MSGSSKKRDDEKAIFDGGEFGIGHNQGPPLDDREAIAAEANENADTETQPLKRGRRVSGSKLTKEALTWLRVREKSGALEKVTWDSPHGSEIVENFERRWSGGSSRDGSGKWRNPDGLVSRRGKRRIVPESRNSDEIECDLWLLREIAEQVLHGRNATIFEKLVIKPLEDGGCHPPVEGVAAQFNITLKRAYKIRDKCWDRVLREHNRRQQQEAQEDGSAICGICGKRRSSDLLCPRGRYWGCEESVRPPGADRYGRISAQKFSQL